MRPETLKCAGSTLNSCHATSKERAGTTARRPVKTNTLPIGAISSFAADGSQMMHGDSFFFFFFTGAVFSARSSEPLVINMLLPQPRWGCRDHRAHRAPFVSVAAVAAQYIRLQCSPKLRRRQTRGFSRTVRLQSPENVLLALRV